MRLRTHERLAVALFACVVGAAVAAMGYAEQSPFDMTLTCDGDSCSLLGDITDGWFDPAYSHNMRDVARAIEDRWFIGHGVYATRDLMGRRI